jgi:queuine/archaeosine tRNA-ribosyltransferase
LKNLFKITYEGEGKSRVFEEVIRSVKLTSPFFVPSISSVRKVDLNLMAKALTEIPLPERIFMLSAYDLKNLNKQSIDKFDACAENNVLYLDSGGYEAHYYEDSLWDISGFFQGINKIRFDILTVFDRIPSAQETDTITEMKASLLATNKLIKGGGKTLVLQKTNHTRLADLERFLVEVKNEFDILGIPKKQCGRGVEGVNFIRNLRQFMDREKIIKPIHIFGCGQLNLIPKLVEAGADIFDANSWIWNNYDSSSLFSKKISNDELRKCSCESCKRSERLSSNILIRRYSHNLFALAEAMNLIRQSIIDHKLINLTSSINK